MRRFTTLAALAFVSSILAACGGQSGGSMPSQPQIQTPTTQSLPASQQSSVSTMVQADSTEPHARLNAYYYVPKPPNINYGDIDTAQFAATTVPFFTRKVKSPLNSKTYTLHIVGKNPATSTGTTNVSYVPIVVKWKFGTTVVDPTKPGCNDTVSVESRFFNGPSFNAVPLKSNGVSVGPAQINDGFQRAEFWTSVNGDGYHTMLVPSITKPIVLSETAAGVEEEAGICTGKAHALWGIDINTFDSIIQGIVNKYAKPTQIPLVLSYNIVETEGGGCCVIGYHNAYATTGGTQTYAIGAYTDPGLFTAPGIADIHAWTHEIGELFNDPFVQSTTTENIVPAWGHVGQVSGCQTNLEVGDPLTGTPFTVTYKGFTYHPQELAFFDWFLRTPSEGTGGLYSFEGSFTSAQGKCSSAPT